MYQGILKDQLAWATDKWLWVICIVVSVIPLIIKFITILYALLCGP